MKWETVKLGEVCKIERDGIDPAKIKTGTTYVGLENIVKGGEFKDVQPVSSGDLASTKFIFGPHHVLYGKLRPYLAKIARPHFEGVCSTDILPLLPGPKLNRDYLLYFLRLPDMVELANSRSSGANLPRLSPRVLAEFKIPLPPLAEQERIASLLDAADRLRAQRRDALKRLDALTHSLFLETFGDPAHNPKNWPVVKIGDLLESANYGTSQKAEAVGKYPILRMGNLTYTGRIDLNSLKYIDFSAADEKKYLVRKGDILFNRTNSKELVGKTAVYNLNLPMAFAGYLVRARTNSENHPEYIAAFLNSNYGKATLMGMCKSIVGMANINAKEMQSISIGKPPPSLQLEFATQLEQIETLRARMERSRLELDALFGSLQNRAFAGK